MKKTTSIAISLLILSIQNAWAETKSYTISELLAEQKIQLKNGDELQLSDEYGELGTMDVTAIRFNGNQTQISVTLNKNGLIYPGSLMLINHQTAIFSRQTSSGFKQTTYADGHKAEKTHKNKELFENDSMDENSPRRIIRSQANTRGSSHWKSDSSTSPIVFADEVAINSDAKLQSLHRHGQIKMAVVYDNPTKELLAQLGITDIYTQLSLIQAFFDASNSDTELEFIPIHFDGEFPVGSSVGEKELKYAMSESKEFSDKLLSTEPDFIHTLTNNSNGNFAGVAYSGIGYNNDKIGSYVQPAHLSLGLTKASYLVGGLVSAHEMGHQLGLNHDRYTLANNPNFGAGGNQYDYAIPYGYDNPDGGFYTIMSYGEECRLKSTIGCQRIGLFSNPQQQYSGFYTGVDEQYVEAANSAKWLRLVHNDVAVRKNNPIDIQVIHESEGVRYIWPDIAEQYALVTNLCGDLDDTDIASYFLNNTEDDTYKSVIIGSENSAWLSNQNIGYPSCISLYALSQDDKTSRNIVTKLSDLPTPAISYAANNGTYSLANATLNVSPMTLELPDLGKSKQIDVTLDGNYQSYDSSSAELIARLPQSCSDDIYYCPAWPVTFPRNPAVDYPTLFSELLNIEAVKQTDNKFTIKITNKATSIDQWRLAILDMMRKQGPTGIDDPIVRSRLIPIKIENYFETNNESNPYDFDNRQAVINISFDKLIPEGSLLGDYIHDTNIHPSLPLIAQIQSPDDTVLVYINGELVTTSTEVSGNTVKIYGLNDIIGENAKAKLTIVRGESSLSAEITSRAKLDVNFEHSSYTIQPGSVFTISPINTNNVGGMRIISAPDYVTVSDNRYLNIAPGSDVAQGKEIIEIEITDSNGYKSNHSLAISISNSSTESSGGGSMNWYFLIFILSAMVYRHLKQVMK